MEENIPLCLIGEEAMRGVLTTLDIEPLGGSYITDEEARRVINWRAWREYSLPDYRCSRGLLRQRVFHGDLHVTHPERADGTPHPRINLYDFHEIFHLTIVPKRGLALQRLGNIS